MKITQLQNLMVSIAMRTDMSRDLMEAGFTKVFRTKAQQEQLTALYEAKAKKNTPRKDVYRLGRTDAAGNRQADGGDQIFTTQGQQVVTPISLVDDLTRYGFHLAVAEIFQQEGDEKRVRLRLTWSRNTSTTAVLTEKQENVARRYLGSTYWKLFGYFNAESVDLKGSQNPIGGSITTLNFSGAMDAAAVEQNRDAIREVRMIDSDGHLACPTRMVPVLPPSPVGESVDPDDPDHLSKALEQDLREPRQICPERTPTRFQKGSQ